MALVKCSECGKEISDKALSCPHCGNPIQAIRNAQIAEQNKRYSKELNIQIILYSILGFLASFALGAYLFTHNYLLVCIIIDLVCFAILSLYFKYWIAFAGAVFIRRLRQTNYQIPKYNIVFSSCFGYVFGCVAGMFIYFN